MTIAFLYNVRHQYPDPNDPRTQLETDFDDQETIDGIIKHFKKLKVKVIPIEADKEAYLKLYENKKNIDLVFNYAEGIYGDDRESQIPAMLEMLEIPYTGSSPLTQCLVLNKARAKEILKAHNIPTAPFQVFKSINEKLSASLIFPLIVKPNSQGSSAGITNKSVVKDEKELREQLKFVLNNFSQSALVEKYLDGREYSVPLLGNPPKVFPIISPNHAMLPKEYIKIDSLEVKWHFEETKEGTKDYLSCPAKVDSKSKEKIENICLQTWKALGLRDWCRIDLREDEKGNIYVLEVNSPAGMIPPEVSLTSYFSLSARTIGLSYEDVLREIMETALERHSQQSSDYYGTIIEESLEQKDVLRDLDILLTKVEKVTEHHKTPWLENWTLHFVKIDGKKADSVFEKLSRSLDSKHDSWYADFKNKNFHYIIYRNKTFKVDLNNPVLYKEAKLYGIKIGIPSYQVDFAPEDIVWTR